MKLHESQSKALLAEYGIPVPKGGALLKAEETIPLLARLGLTAVAVKSQVHAGGRGVGHFIGDPKGKGGVVVVSSPQEAEVEVRRMLGKRLVTKQTVAEGVLVKSIYVEEASRYVRQLYLSLVLNRSTNCLMFVSSPEGGGNIEDVAESDPKKIKETSVSPVTGISDFHVRSVASHLGLKSKEELAQLHRIMFALYRLFTEKDADLIEINPLAVDQSGALLALDAKISFDENAMYRQQAIASIIDHEEEDPFELKAKENSLNYVKLDGYIGCMVNGAGLAMATMDIIKLKGSAPANFLDVGGGATVERIIAGFKLILSDTSVKGILVNIFGGIMRCDIIAQGVLAAVKDVGLSLPLVVRLAGTNLEEGRRIIQESGLAVVFCENLDEAASKIVALVQKG